MDIRTKQDLIDYFGESLYKSVMLEFQDEMFDYMEVMFKASTKYSKSENQKIYNNLKKFTITDYERILMQNLPSNKVFYDEMIKEYAEEIGKTDFELHLDNACYKSFVTDMVQLDSFKSMFEETKKIYLNEYADIAGFNTNGTIDEYTELDIVKNKNGIDDITDLSKIKDNVGDNSNLYTDFIDVDDRDAPIIWCDGEVYAGKKGESHSQLIQQYLIDNGREDDIPQDMKENSMSCSRPTKKRMQKLLDAKDVAFGHIVGDMVFLETFEGTSTENKIAKDCKEQLSNVNKVYLYSRGTNVVKRLAKQIYDEYDEEPADVDFYYELAEYNDSVGDKVKVSSCEKELDYYNRDDLFIYIDGKVYGGNGEKNLTHSEIISDNYNDVANSKNLVTGHILNNIGFIETVVGNVDLSSVANQCKFELNLDKVYLYDRNSEFLTRIAKNYIRIQ